jgi:hypothetical protein
MAVARWSSRLSIRSSQAQRSSRLRGSKTQASSSSRSRRCSAWTPRNPGPRGSATRLAANGRGMRSYRTRPWRRQAACAKAQSPKVFPTSVGPVIKTVGCDPPNPGAQGRTAFPWRGAVSSRVSGAAETRQGASRNRRAHGQWPRRSIRHRPPRSHVPRTLRGRPHPVARAPPESAWPWRRSTAPGRGGSPACRVQTARSREPASASRCWDGWP